MIPVMMERLTSDTEAYRACLASILQLDLDDVPSYEGYAATMQWNAWLASELNLMVLSFAWGDIVPPPGLWIARVPSPYPVYVTHTIVCAGTQPVHDPHPEATDSATYPVVETVQLFALLDPGELSGRFIRG